MFGGLLGENSNSNIGLLNLQTNVWSQLLLKTQISEIARDDFATADIRDGSFFTFGGYVNGSRTDDVVKFRHEGSSVEATPVAGECAGGPEGPTKRASMSVGVHEQKMYVFGGQENDNKKLNDLWCFDLQSGSWSQVDQSGADYKPTPRSGHSTIVYGDKMYIFGGILELTKELNDLVVFNFQTRQFSSCSDQQEDDLNQTGQNQEMTSPEAKSATLTKKRTMAANSMSRSPTKKMTDSNLPKQLTASKKDSQDSEAKSRLTSPTSVSMKNTFIIKNADESFEVNSKLLPKNKQRLTETQSVKYTDLVEGQRPPPRDGHSAVVDSQGFMYIFGGDRHHMPFNDLYMIKLE